MTATAKKLISSSSEWSFELLESYEKQFARLATGYRLDTYPNQIEIINAEQMMDAYASVGMPINYHHWSFGKHFINVEQNYRRGHMGLAYELVINSNPCIAYLQEENTMVMQALVIAHACFGHNSFFKNNYLFRAWTDAESIIDYLVFARGYIAQCEERYGVAEVEAILDSCHALMNQGVDRYRRPPSLSPEKERNRQREREVALQQQINALWRTIPQKKVIADDANVGQFPPEPEENLLYFIEKNAPLLEPWQRELVRIVRKMSQYLYPQRQTQVMNEGWACFWHFQLIQDLYHEGLVDDGFMLEFLQYHTSVIYQPPYDMPGFNGINPYTLGFSMMRDIRRICEQPTAEDRKWFPDIAGSPWLDTLHFAMENFKDESFIQQFLSPRLIRELSLFAVVDDASKDHLEVAAIHDDHGYQMIREALGAMYNLGMREPDIQIVNADIAGTRALTLRHDAHQARPLAAQSANEVLRHIRRLWGFDVRLDSVDGERTIATYHCREQAEDDQPEPTARRP